MTCCCHTSLLGRQWWWDHHDCSTKKLDCSALIHVHLLTFICLSGFCQPETEWEHASQKRTCKSEHNVDITASNAVIRIVHITAKQCQAWWFLTCCCTRNELRTQGQTALHRSILSKEEILQFADLRINAENKGQNDTFCCDAPS